MNTVTPTEQDLLNNVPGLEAEDTAQVTSNEVFDQETTSNESAGPATGEEVVDGTKDQQAKPTTPEATAKEEPKETPRNPGDLIDKTTGEVLAKAGAERRVFEKAAKHISREFQSVLQEYNTRVKTLETELNTYRTANTIANQYQISPDEQTYAMQIMANYKRDPIGTIKLIIAEAQAQGYNMGADVAMTPDVVQKMVQQSVAPLLEDRQRQQQMEQQHNQIVQTYNNFMQRFPDARQHENVLAELLQRDPRLSLEEAYYQLRLAASERGLDWNKPLHEQIQRKSVQSQPTANMTIPTGRGMSNRTAPAVSQASGSTPYRDIVRQAMAEQGITLE